MKVHNMHVNEVGISGKYTLLLLAALKLAVQSGC